MLHQMKPSSFHHTMECQKGKGVEAPWNKCQGLGTTTKKTAPCIHSRWKRGLQRLDPTQDFSVGINTFSFKEENSGEFLTIAESATGRGSAAVLDKEAEASISPPPPYSKPEASCPSLKQRRALQRAATLLRLNCHTDEKKFYTVMMS